MRQILSCLYYMHEKKIAYKNLKLKNIMFLHPYEVGEKVKIKLIDFGCAVKEKTKYVNNHHYQNDIWNCGMIFYFLLKGENFKQRKLTNSFGFNLNL